MSLNVFLFFLNVLVVKQSHAVLKNSTEFQDWCPPVYSFLTTNPFLGKTNINKSFNKAHVITLPNASLAVVSDESGSLPAGNWITPSHIKGILSIFPLQHKWNLIYSKYLHGPYKDVFFNKSYPVLCLKQIEVIFKYWLGIKLNPYHAIYV